MPCIYTEFLQSVVPCPTVAYKPDKTTWNLDPTLWQDSEGWFSAELVYIYQKGVWNIASLQILKSDQHCYLPNELLGSLCLIITFNSKIL